MAPTPCTWPARRKRRVPAWCGACWSWVWMHMPQMPKARVRSTSPPRRAAGPWWRRWIRNATCRWRCAVMTPASRIALRCCCCASACWTMPTPMHWPRCGRWWGRVSWTPCCATTRSPQRRRGSSGCCNKAPRWMHACRAPCCRCRPRWQRAAPASPACGRCSRPAAHPPVAVAWRGTWRPAWPRRVVQAMKPSPSSCWNAARIHSACRRQAIRRSRWRCACNGRACCSS